MVAMIEVKGWAALDDNDALTSAKRLAGKGQWRDALEGMLAEIVEDRDPARDAMLAAFLVLGDEEPLVGEYRRRLTNALF
jgi:thioredoxin-like negative regulator of GroEL